MAPGPDLWLFFSLVLAVIALPGMDMAFVVSNSLNGGWTAGASALGGIIAGGLVHVIVAAAGVSLLLAASPAAFDGLLLAGSGYMGWISCGMWRASLQASPVHTGAEVGTHHRHLRVFRQGMLTCLLNPKACAFTLAVLPAFLTSSDGPAASLSRAICLASIIVGTQFAVYGSAAAIAAHARSVLAVGERGSRWLLRATGAILAAGAVATLLLGWKPLLMQQ